MPPNLSIAAFVLGAILLLVALVGGGFKLFGAEIPGGVSGLNRKIALVLALALIVGAVLSEQKETPQQPASSAASVNTRPEGISSGTPNPHKIRAADVYVHPSGSFERLGEIWIEYPPYAPSRNHRFKEARRDDQFIYLYDETRHKENDPVRVFYLRIPLSGGMAEWSYPNPFEWHPLYPVTPKSK